MRAGKGVGGGGGEGGGALRLTGVAGVFPLPGRGCFQNKKSLAQLVCDTVHSHPGHECWGEGLELQATGEGLLTSKKYL